MPISLVEIIVAAVVGGVASLIAPWANWGVKKREKKLVWRKGLINECKRIIDKPNFDNKRFRVTPNYSNLKPYLSENLKRYVNSRKYSRRTISGRVNIPFLKEKLLEEINILERKWGLI